MNFVIESYSIIVDKDYFQTSRSASSQESDLNDLSFLASAAGIELDSEKLKYMSRILKNIIPRYIS